MGLFSWVVDKISDVKDWVVDKVEDTVDAVKDFLFGKKYDSSKVSDQVDVAAALAKVRDEYSCEINEAENEAMNEMNSLFNQLFDIANKQNYFSDLSSVIKYHKDHAEWELKGTIISYITEHLSQNDPKFKKVLEMKPSPAKKDDAFKDIKTQAFIEYGKSLKTYTEKILNEFEERFNSRINDQENQAKQKIEELEKIMADAEAGMVDVDKIEDECAPAMEASQCIITVLNKAVII